MVSPVTAVPALLLSAVLLQLEVLGNEQGFLILQLCGSIFRSSSLALAIKPDIRWWGYKWRGIGHMSGDDDKGASTANYDDDYGIWNFHWSLWDI